LCGRSAAECLSVDSIATQFCFPCAARLGRSLVSDPRPLEAVWPGLVEEDEDDEDAEPRVRLDDGRSVELRQRTAELKKDLPVEARMQLAMTLGELGLHREQMLECAYVLSTEPPEKLARLALSVLFLQPVAVDEPLARLREVLFPG
jgi:hypothetical protein